jgi:type II secretory pathway pseudopilin PulG
VSRGFALLEAAVAAGIVAVAAASLLFALSTSGRFMSHQSGPLHEAALLLATQTVRDAQQAWKYGAPGGAPQGTIPVTLPPSNAPASLNVTLSGNRLHVQVSYTPDPQHQDGGSVAIDALLEARAPLPGSRVDHPGLIPVPTPTPCC